MGHSALIKKLLLLRLNQLIRNNNLRVAVHLKRCMSLDEVIEKLRQLGLTEYETQAYLALIQGNKMGAEEIARAADIPVPRVYSVLESLKNLGLIVVIKGRPKRFEIINPEEGLQNLLTIRKRAAEESLRQLEQVCRSVQQVLSPIFWHERLHIRPEDLLESLDSLSAAEERTKKLISDAHYTLDIFTDIFSWFEIIDNDLSNASRRGVKIRVLMNMESSATRETVHRLHRLGIPVRHPRDVHFPVRGTIADASKVVFIIWASPESGDPSRPKYVYRPSFSANEGITAIFQQSFEFRWRQARPPRSHS